jgi:FkbM family methyltransferase
VDQEVPAILQIHGVLSSQCGGSDRSALKPVFLDSGANDGIWSLMAAHLGCRAVAVEPQLRCMRGLAAMARENGNLQITAYQNMLSTAAFSAEVNTEECTGTRMFPGAGKVSDVFFPDKEVKKTACVQQACSTLPIPTPPT